MSGSPWFPKNCPQKELQYPSQEHLSLLAATLYQSGAKSEEEAVDRALEIWWWAGSKVHEQWNRLKKDVQLLERHQELFSKPLPITEAFKKQLGWIKSLYKNPKKFEIALRKHNLVCGSGSETSMLAAEQLRELLKDEERKRDRERKRTKRSNKVLKKSSAEKVARNRDGQREIRKFSPQKRTPSTKIGNTLTQS